MLFNSLEFALFLPIVFIFYWSIGSNRRNVQNLFLLLASYVFYGWWDWRFLSLIAISTVVDYVAGLKIHRSESSTLRRAALVTSIVINIGFLAVFKYYGFFVESFMDLASFFGLQLNIMSLRVVLPVGISFYTFQTLSYSIDVYRKQIEPTRDFIAFAAYVSFFPQLVAGPIERARNLLPQFNSNRKFDHDRAVDGMRQMLWGLFKKMAIADVCAPIVNDIFSNYQSYHWTVLLTGSVLFSFQIYGDFSGYSDIAIGTARLFGFDLRRNFAYPYFSRDIAEFWRRWHISLSSWFRDYVYIPFGGSRGGRYKVFRNVMLVFVISGLWHGANWTFVLWGAVNGLLVYLMFIVRKNRANLDIVAENRSIPSFSEVAQVVSTFVLVSLIWIIFRAESIQHAMTYFGHMVSLQNGVFPKALMTKLEVVFPILIMLIVEFYNRHYSFGLERLPLYKPYRWGAYYVLLMIIFVSGSVDSGIEFIYFQF